MPTPTKEMAAEAQKGLDWRKEYGRGGTEVGVARARDISNRRDLSMDTVRRMKSYFARHEVDKEAQGFYQGQDGFPSAGRIAWQLWGGDAGRDWTDMVLETEDNERMDDMRNGVILSPQMEAVDMSQKEVRALHKSVEIREDDQGEVRVSGYAAVFGEETNIGGMFTEEIQRGAFVDAIGRDDVVFLINHDGLPLARTRSGTLTLREDDHGLYMEAMLDPSDPDVRSILPKMKRGDLDKMSFAFIPTRQEWDDSSETPKRMIQEAQLFDVSIVTTPAYSGTEIGLRSLEQFREANQKSQAQRRIRMKSRLQK
jgi:HK97 family phage prohead protease